MAPKALVTPATAVAGASSISNHTDGIQTDAPVTVAVAAPLDFIGSSVSVKDLFALPYAVDRPISVALHNMGGTLLIDMDHGDARLLSSKQQELSFQKRVGSYSGKANDAGKTGSSEESSDKDGVRVDSDVERLTSQIIALSPCLETSVEQTDSLTTLTIVNSIIQSVTGESAPTTTLPSQQQQRHQQRMLDFTPPEEDSVSNQYIPHLTTPTTTTSTIPQAPEPREYLSWKFHGMNLLIGSDALIYRSPPSLDDSHIQATDTHDTGPTVTTTSTANPGTSLMVRVEEVDTLQAAMHHHQSQIHAGQFIADYQHDKLQQRGKPSYAQKAAAAGPQQHQQVRTALCTDENYHNATAQSIFKNRHRVADTHSSASRVSSSLCFAAPDLDQVQLQTCKVPVLNSDPLSVGSLLSKGNDPDSDMNINSRTDESMGRPGDSFEKTSCHASIHPSGAPLSPVSTVLDTYLDNIMANVPQLALCLREKGFIQSVKLLNTNDIPSRMLQPNTLDTSVPFEAIPNGPESDPADEIFSPQIMEMNAQALLRFLKSNCTKDNATYLLRRDAGRTNIQLYDISSISAQRQQKWVWWLATISYRFSHRLRHLSLQAVSDSALRRSFRVRQRSLLHNTLELLETLSDMNGHKHESLIAAVSENLADTYLVIGGDDDDADATTGGLQTTKVASPIVPPPQAVSSHQPYTCISVDALSKAQDHLVFAIKILGAVLDQSISDGMRTSKKKLAKQRAKKDAVISATPNENSTSDASDSDDDAVYKNGTMDDEQTDPVVTQLFGIHQRLVNVSLRLAEIHLKNYWSSSAMQNLRTAANRIADSLYLVQLMDHRHGEDRQQWLPKVHLQYTWLWEQCGHFARSFAADQHWRDRGHASGDDVVNNLQDVEAAFTERHGLERYDPLKLHRFVKPSDPLSIKSKDMVNLQSLSGVVDFCRQIDKPAQRISDLRQKGIKEAIRHLEGQKILQRDERRVLVAAVIAYSRAVNSLEDYIQSHQGFFNKQLVELLRQRLGDACNETGKVMLNELRHVISSLGSETCSLNELAPSVAIALCSSAEFWFLEGLHAFEVCKDLRNLALLRCNICQCYKLRANAILSKLDSKLSEDANHAETCLQEAANHLQAAHETLGVRENDSMTWDMVSDELAATFLVLGVRRRQALIGSGNSLLILQALRLSPGKERSIVDPMERALRIYEEMGSSRQSAAAHYQLAQFYSKTWTSQRDETKTREKLLAAFKHYNAAYAFFAHAAKGDEATFCLLCLDLANLYSVVSGVECLSKALLCCLDASVAFSPDAIQNSVSNTTGRLEWFENIDTLSNSVEELTFKILKSLVKLEDAGTCEGKKFKGLYLSGLTSKMTLSSLPPNFVSGDKELDAIAIRILGVHHVLLAIKEKYDSCQTMD